MKNFLLVLVFVLSIVYCNCQNILVFEDSAQAFYANNIEQTLDNLGYTYITRRDEVLTTADFTGIDVLLDLVIGEFNGPCPDFYTNSISTIQEFLDTGGAAFFQFDNEFFNQCGTVTLDNLVNPYLVSPVSIGSTTITNCAMASSLPSDKTCVLSNPNSIGGNSYDCDGCNNFLDTIDSNSVLSFAEGDTNAGVYGGPNDVMLIGARYILWSDINTAFHSNPTDAQIFRNMMEYLLEGCCGGTCGASEVCNGDSCCDITIHCDGLVCGTGACGYSCGTCGASDICDAGACVCNTAIECDGLDCGPGACSGDCGSCGATEVCDAGACICNTAIECDGLDCGPGTCSGDCGSCGATEVCDAGACICNAAIECDGFECGSGVCGGDCGTCSAGDVCSVNTCEEFYSSPKSHTKWSIYHSGCIRWDTANLEENIGDIFLEYGSSFSLSREIASSVDLTTGEHEWIIYGCFPSTARIVIVYQGSGNTQVGQEFTLYGPSTGFSETC